MNKIAEKIYRYKFNIIAGMFLALGGVFIVTNAIVLIKFGFSSVRMDELNIENLHSGIYIKDNLTHTYGNIGEYTGGKPTKIYLVDIGSEHNQYMEMSVKQSSFYKKDNDINKLHTFFPGNYRVLNTSRKVKMYAVIEKRKVLFYDFYKELFNKGTDELNESVATDYYIRVVSPNDYKRSLIEGILILIAGGVIFVYAHFNNKKKTKIGENESEETENKPIGLFSRGVLENREVLCVELVWDSGNIIFKEKDIIEDIISALDDVEDESENFSTISGSALCTFIFQLEDCTDIIFEMWTEKRIKSVGGFYIISDDAYNELNDIWKGKEY